MGLTLTSTFDYSQLFGEVDPDQDVSPDTEDPEAAGDAGQSAADADAKTDAIGTVCCYCGSTDFQFTAIYFVIIDELHGDFKYMYVYSYYVRPLQVVLNANQPACGPRNLVMILRKYSTRYSKSTI